MFGGFERGFLKDKNIGRGSFNPERKPPHPALDDPEFKAKVLSLYGGVLPSIDVVMKAIRKARLALENDPNNRYEEIGQECFVDYLKVLMWNAETARSELDKSPALMEKVHRMRRYLVEALEEIKKEHPDGTCGELGPDNTHLNRKGTASDLIVNDPEVSSSFVEYLNGKDLMRIAQENPRIVPILEAFARENNNGASD